MSLSPGDRGVVRWSRHLWRTFRRSRAGRPWAGSSGHGSLSHGTSRPCEVAGRGEASGRRAGQAGPSAHRRRVSRCVGVGGDPVPARGDCVRRRGVADGVTAGNPAARATGDLPGRRDHAACGFLGPARRRIGGARPAAAPAAGCRGRARLADAPASRLAGCLAGCRGRGGEEAASPVARGSVPASGLTQTSRAGSGAKTRPPNRRPGRSSRALSMTPQRRRRISASSPRWRCGGVTWCNAPWRCPLLCHPTTVLGHAAAACLWRGAVDGVTAGNPAARAGRGSARSAGSCGVRVPWPGAPAHWREPGSPTRRGARPAAAPAAGCRARGASGVPVSRVPGRLPGAWRRGGRSRRSRAARCPEAD